MLLPFEELKDQDVSISSENNLYKDWSAWFQHCTLNKDPSLHLHEKYNFLFVSTPIPTNSSKYFINSE